MNTYLETTLKKPEKRDFSLSKAIKAPILYQLCRADQKALKTAIFAELLKYREIFKNSVSEKGAAILCELIIERYPTESFEDVCLCLKWGAAGKFGNNYKTFDADTVWAWFSGYMELKLDEKERQLQNKKAEIEDKYYNIDYSEEGIKKMVEKIGKKRDKDPVQKKMAENYAATQQLTRLPDKQWSTPKGGKFTIEQVGEFFTTIKNTENGQAIKVENPKIWAIIKQQIQP